MYAAPTGHAEARALVVPAASVSESGPPDSAKCAQPSVAVSQIGHCVAMLSKRLDPCPA